MRLKEGDRVRIATDDSRIGRVLNTDVGTVQYRSSSGNCYVRWDRYDEGRHNNNGRCEKGHGWMLHEVELELLEPNDLGDFSAPTCLDTKFLFGM